jgi:hypothetical protein
VPKIREHHDPKARLARLEGLIKDEPRDKAKRLARKWSMVEEEIALIKEKMKAEKSASK